MDRPRILFLGMHNAITSQMSESLMRLHAGDAYEIYSAGMQATPIDPLTIQVLDEAGCDMRAACSKNFSDLVGIISFSLIVTVCKEIHSLYTFSPGSSMLIDWDFKDSTLFPAQGETRLACFRELRNQVDTKVIQFLADLHSASKE